MVGLKIFRLIPPRVICTTNNFFPFCTLHQNFFLRMLSRGWQWRKFFCHCYPSIIFKKAKKNFGVTAPSHLRFYTQAINCSNFFSSSCHWGHGPVPPGSAPAVNYLLLSLITVNCQFHYGQSRIYYGQHWPYGQPISGPVIRTPSRMSCKNVSSILFYYDTAYTL